jgi:carbonic anhydrase
MGWGYLPGLIHAAAALAAVTCLSAWPAAAVDLCASGRRQSPIDIQATKRAALPALAVAYRAAPLRVVNDGHTVRVRFANGSRLQLGHEMLVLQQFHFHRPGGERIHGEEFPMAMHLVHKAPSGQLVTVVAPFRVGAAHAGLATLLPQMPEAGAPERSVPGVLADAAQFLPAARGYYAYEGSLTSPPCTEGVRWLVLKQAQTLSTAQLDALALRVPPNARSLQPLNGRIVRESS